MYPIYCISGLGADYRVFKHLEKDFNLIHIPWIEPKLNEDLLTYGKRLIQNINFQRNFICWV